MNWNSKSRATHARVTDWTLALVAAVVVIFLLAFHVVPGL